MQFEPGEIVLRRHYMRDDLLSRVWVGRVVADDEHGLWIWVAVGSPFLDIGAADGRSFRQIPFSRWLATPKALLPRTWLPGSALMLHPHGAAHSVWLGFTADGTFRDWYVNLEEPVTRWRDGRLSGVDTVDQDLDVVVGPDRGWRWKDADEFADHLTVPEAYWVDDPEAVWAEGKRVIEQVEAGGFPFDGTRTDFRPDPEWTTPAEVPPGWDRPRAR